LPKIQVHIVVWIKFRIQIRFSFDLQESKYVASMDKIFFINLQNVPQYLYIMRWTTNIWLFFAANSSWKFMLRVYAYTFPRTFSKNNLVILFSITYGMYYCTLNNSIVAHVSFAIIRKPLSVIVIRTYIQIYHVMCITCREST